MRLEMTTMNYAYAIFLYVLLLVSFFCAYAAVKKGHKAWRYVIFLIYLATGILFTLMLIGEIRTPSEDANIGLGFSIMLTEIVGIAGIIVAGITYLLRRK